MSNITDKDRETLFNFPTKAYATIIPSRTTKPVVCLHTTLGQAKNAVNAQSYGGEWMDVKGRRMYVNKVAEAEVYELTNGKWQLLWRIERDTPKIYLPWKK